MGAHTGVLIQARTGSTRLPGKMTRLFLNGKTIPWLLITKLKQRFEADSIVLCTTESEGDDALVELAFELGVRCFRGHENDVLQRFIDAADGFGFDTVYRICADNPLLRLDGLAMLEEAFNAEPLDYVTLCFADGTPIMKGHIGLYAELMRVDFLRDIARRTEAPIYREHVTNFVYENRALYATRFVTMPEQVASRYDLRLTIDTETDFTLVAELCQRLLLHDPETDAVNDPSLEHLLEVIANYPGAIDKMKAEISQQRK
jgi:spore coat polysaccharide biosynthesis protein SpsF